MANWQVISLDTTTPQLRAPGTGDGYSFNSGSTQLGVWTTTGLGVGTASPSGKLDVRGANSNNLSDLSTQIVSAIDTTAYAQNNGGGIGFGYLFNSGGSVIGRAAVIKAVKENATDGNYATSLVFANAANSANTIEKMRLDSSGNLGLGVTPSAWTSLNVFQASRGSVAATTAEIDVNHNAYYDGAWKYIANGFATNHYQASGAYVWRTAASGTAGNTISFTQAMTLTAGGEFLVGTTATTAGARLDVKGVDSTGSNYCMFFENSGSALLLAVQNDGRWRSGTAAASPYNYVVGATNRDLFVDNGGDIGYVSSVRASKTNITPDVDTDWLLQLNPVTFNFRKRDEDGNYTDEADGPIKHGLIAEEVEQVNADLCFYDDEDKGGALRGVNYSHLITPMLKLIQNQQAMINELKAEVAALKGA